MPSSDRIVTCKIVLQAQMEVRRLGLTKVLELLENLEPELTEYLLEDSTALYHEILKTGASGKQARSIHQHAQMLLLVCIRSLQGAHAALWLRDPSDDPPSGSVSSDPPSSEPPL